MTVVRQANADEPMTAAAADVVVDLLQLARTRHEMVVAAVEIIRTRDHRIAVLERQLNALRDEIRRYTLRAVGSASKAVA